MTDVNEEIVRQYFELKGYFVQTDVPYFKPKGQTGKKSSGYGDIDLIVTNPKTTSDNAIVGVSGWHTERITPSYAKDWGDRLFSFVSPLALATATQLLGTQEFKKILIVSRLGSKQSSKRAFINEAKKRGVTDVIEFPDILKQLIALVKTEPSYDSEVLQILRLLKIYDLLK